MYKYLRSGRGVPRGRQHDRHTKTSGRGLPLTFVVSSLVPGRDRLNKCPVEGSGRYLVNELSIMVSTIDDFAHVRGDARGDRVWTVTLKPQFTHTDGPSVTLFWDGTQRIRPVVHLRTWASGRDRFEINRLLYLWTGVGSEVRETTFGPTHLHRPRPPSSSLSLRVH